MRHIQAHLKRLLLQIFFMLHLIIFQVFKFLFNLFKSFYLTQQPKKNQPVFSPIKIIFKTPVSLVLIKLYIYKDVFIPTYYFQYQFNSQLEKV